VFGLNYRVFLIYWLIDCSLLLDVEGIDLVFDVLLGLKLLFPFIFDVLGKYYYYLIELI
jgi:hypothetical protein